MSAQYEAPASDLAAIREICERYGFCLVKGLLTRDDLNGLLAGMRAASHAAAGGLLSDLLGLPELRHIYFDPRLLELARALLGPDLVYDGEGTVNFEETVGHYTLNPYSKLHCDAKGMREDLKAHWHSPSDAIYRAYRIGIYFHDYTTASGALKVIVGSHRGDPASFRDSRLLRGPHTERILGGNRIAYPKTTHPLYNLRNQPGDVVVWNLRTFHSAGAKLFTDDPAFAAHPSVESQIEAQAPELIAPPPGPRNALFFDYAAPCEEIDLYIKMRAQPTLSGLEGRLKRRSDDPALLELARSHGVAVRHDTLITGLALALATNNGPNPVRKMNAAEVEAVAARLYRLASAHEEYSPHFQLFDRARFEAAANRNAALASMRDDILAATLARVS